MRTEIISFMLFCVKFAVSSNKLYMQPLFCVKLFGSW